MSCSEVDVNGYFLEELSPGEREETERHLPGCQECREELARLETVPTDDEGTVVVPVPDTSKAAADSMAYALGVPCVEGLPWLQARWSARWISDDSERWKGS